MCRKPGSAPVRREPSSMAEPVHPARRCIDTQEAERIICPRCKTDQSAARPTCLSCAMSFEALFD